MRRCCQGIFAGDERSGPHHRHRNVPKCSCCCGAVRVCFWPRLCGNAFDVWSLRFFGGAGLMKRFAEGLDREQSRLFPGTLENFAGEDTAVRVIEAAVEALDLGALGFSAVSTRKRPAAWFPMTRRLPAFAKTTGPPSARPVLSSSRSAAISVCLPRRAWRSTAASSQRSTTGTAISRPPRRSAGWLGHKNLRR